MKKQMGDQCYDSISTSCFMSAPTIEGLNQKPILDNNFVCSDHQTVGLALYSTCIVMTPEVGMKPQVGSILFRIRQKPLFSILVHPSRCFQWYRIKVQKIGESPSSLPTIFRGEMLCTPLLAVFAKSGVRPFGSSSTKGTSNKITNFLK